jgi:hypothetical protein
MPIDLAEPRMIFIAALDVIRVEVLHLRFRDLAHLRDGHRATVSRDRMNLRPDPTFYPTPKMAMEAPVETLAFTLMLSPDGSQPDGLAVVDVDPAQRPMARSCIRSSCPTRATSFTISAGTPVPRRCRR